MNYLCKENQLLPAEADADDKEEAATSSLAHESPEDDLSGVAIDASVPDSFILRKDRKELQPDNNNKTCFDDESLARKNNQDEVKAR